MDRNKADKHIHNRFNREFPKDFSDMSKEQLIGFLTHLVKDPYHLDGLSRMDLEHLLEETEDEIAQLQEKLEAIEERLGTT